MLLIWLGRREEEERKGKERRKEGRGKEKGKGKEERTKRTPPFLGGRGEG